MRIIFKDGLTIALYSIDGVPSSASFIGSLSALDVERALKSNRESVAKRNKK